MAREFQPFRPSGPQIINNRLDQTLPAIAQEPSLAIRMQNYPVICHHSKSIGATKSEEVDVFRRYTDGSCENSSNASAAECIADCNASIVCRYVSVMEGPKLDCCMGANRWLHPGPRLPSLCNCLSAESKVYPRLLVCNNMLQLFPITTRKS